MLVFKILIFQLLIAAVFLYYGIKFAIGKDKIEVSSGKVYKRTGHAIGVLSILLAIYFPAELIMDLTLSGKQEAIITVSDVLYSSDGDDMYLPVLLAEPLADDNRLNIWFYSVSIKEGHRYRVEYLKQSRILLKAEKIP